MTGVWAAAASLLLGAACPGCGVPGAGLCPACGSVVAAPTPARWAVAAMATPVVAAAPYAGVWRRCLIAGKERGVRWLLRPLGEALALAVAVACAGTPRAPLVLVPVPSRARAVRERGMDTTLALARVAARVLRDAGVEVRVDACLRVHGRVSDQSELGERGRQENLREAMRARRAPDGLVVVVDDLVTTGASLAEASRALAAVGAAPAGHATVAATPRRDGRHRAGRGPDVAEG